MSARDLSVAELHGPPVNPKRAARRFAKDLILGAFEPEALHAYTDADGTSLYWRIRARLANSEKWIRPMRREGIDYALGEPDFDAGKPLYRLHELALHPSAPCWYVEGESCADALCTLGVLVTTAGSASSDETADYAPLAGRTVTVWPDADDAGIAHAERVATKLAALGCSVELIDSRALGLADKGDCVDWLRLHPGATVAHLAKLPRFKAQPGSTNPADAARAAEESPAALDDAAFHGIAGEFVRMNEPHTEADPAAILIQFLVAFGALVGPGPYYRVEGDRHHANLFALLVGATSKGRKGTAWGRVRDVFEAIDSWKPAVSGLSSGEGLKWHVRDPREETKRNKHGETVTEITDEGVSDKRLLVTESEFASALRAAQRHGSTLSPTMRESWDSGNLRTLTKHDSITATGAHIAIVGHITADELRAELTGTDTANGFANRFLFVAVRRSKLLPFGGECASDAMQALSCRLRELAGLARTRGRIGMSDSARRVWTAVYPTLSGERDGLHGAVTARAEAQCVRLALVYALLDGQTEIDAPHLLAALAVWEYCNATARYVFGASLGDRTADEIMRRLWTAGDAGMSRTDISAAFGRHVMAERIGAALDLLRRRGEAECQATQTGGRPTELWHAKKAN